MRGDVLAQAMAGFVQAGLGGAGSAGDLPGWLVGVSRNRVTAWRCPGAGRRPRGPARRHDPGPQPTAGRAPMPGAGPRASRRAGSAGRGAAGRGRRWPRCAQPAGEPAGVAQPVQRDERLQEGVTARHRRRRPAAGTAGPRGPRAIGRCRSTQQPERRRIASAGQPDQVTVRDVHALPLLLLAVSGRAGDSSALRSSTRPRPASEMPNRMMRRRRGRASSPHARSSRCGRGRSGCCRRDRAAGRRESRRASLRPDTARRDRRRRWCAAVRGR